MDMPPRTSRAKDTKVVNFRITAELHDLLLRYAENMRDDSGQPLSTGQAARRIVVASLGKLEEQGKQGKKEASS
jgi:hypothetical protein